MCLIAWNWQPGSKTPLLLVANRDEFYARPALPVHRWEDGQLLAGKDLQAGGTWLGLGRDGRLAALTNFRLPANDPGNKPSRGALVTNFLRGNQNALDYLTELAQRADVYNPFNLLLFDGNRLLGLESRKQRIVFLQPGLGGVSNADFDTPWPKLARLKSGLQKQCSAERTAIPDLLPLLQERTLAADANLPQTGIPLELERKLSATFIASENYGTRASSIVTLHQDNSSFFEQSYGPHGVATATQQFFTP